MISGRPITVGDYAALRERALSHLRASGGRCVAAALERAVLGATGGPLWTRLLREALAGEPRCREVGGVWELVQPSGLAGARPLLAGAPLPRPPASPRPEPEASPTVDPGSESVPAQRDAVEADAAAGVAGTGAARVPAGTGADEPRGAEGVEVARALFDGAFVVLDVEATGARPERHRVTEVAALVVERGEVVLTFHSLVNPARRVPRLLHERTGLTQELADEAPAFAEVADELLATLGDRPIVGHEVRAAVAFLQKELARLDRLPLFNPRVELIDLAMRWLPASRRRKPSLENLAAAAGVSFPLRRGALRDARVVAAVALATLRRALGAPTAPADTRGWTPADPRPSEEPKPAGGASRRPPSHRPGKVPLARVPAGPPPAPPEGASGLGAGAPADCAGDAERGAGSRPLGRSVAGEADPPRSGWLPAPCALPLGRPDDGDDDVAAARRRLDWQIATAPEAPGVYLMRDAEGEVLYVGRSVNLRRRLMSYVSGPIGVTRQLEGLLDAAASVEWEALDTEIDAILAESRLIRRHAPRFNVQRAARPAPLWLKVDLAEEFPRLALAPGPRPDGAAYFGPFRTGAAAARALRWTAEVIPIRTCQRRMGARRNPKLPPCARLARGLCLGPCTGDLLPAGYRPAVDAAVAFLGGDRGVAERELHRRIAAHLGRGDRVGAARWRETLRRLQGFDPRAELADEAGPPLDGVLLLPAHNRPDRALFLVVGGAPARGPLLSGRLAPAEVAEALTAAYRAARGRNDDEARLERALLERWWRERPERGHATAFGVVWPVGEAAWLDLAREVLRRATEPGGLGPGVISDRFGGTEPTDP